MAVFEAMTPTLDGGVDATMTINASIDGVLLYNSDGRLYEPFTIFPDPVFNADPYAEQWLSAISPSVDGTIGTAFFQAIQAVSLTQESAGVVGRFGVAEQSVAVTQSATGLAGFVDSVAQAISLSHGASGLYGAVGSSGQTIALVQEASGLAAYLGGAVQAIELSGEAQTGSTAIQSIGLAQSVNATYTISLSQSIGLGGAADGTVQILVLHSLVLVGSASGLRAALGAAVHAFNFGGVAYVPGTRIWGALEPSVEVVSGDVTIHFAE